MLPAFTTLSVRIGPPPPAGGAEPDRPGPAAARRVEPSPRAPRDRVTLSDRAREQLTPERRRVLDALVQRDAEGHTPATAAAGASRRELGTHGRARAAAAAAAYGRGARAAA